MKRQQILVIIIALIVSISLFGVDQITQLEKQISESSDINKTKLYNQLSIEYLKKNNLKKYYEFANKTLKNAEMHKQIEQQINALLHISHYYYEKSDFFKGRPYLKKALILANPLKNTEILINVWREQFNVYGSCDTKEDYIYSLKISKNLERLYKENKDLKNQVLFVHIQGTYYALLNDLKMSIKYINKALLLYKKLGNKKKVAQMYTYLANRIQQLGDNKKAFKYLISASNEAKKIKKLGF